MERMSPLDAAFLQIEDEERETQMGIASIAVFDGTAPSHEELVRNFESRLPYLPRYRQRVLSPWWDLSAPVWVDDPDFDIDYHLRRTALPAPGDDAALFRLMGRVMAQRLDRDRPLWEVWVIEGLQDGGWALISKLHHCMADGVSGTEIYHLLLSTTPDVVVPPPAQQWHPRPLPSSLRLTADAARELALSPLRQLQLVRATARAPRRAVARVAETAAGLRALAGAARPVAGSSLSGPIGPHRKYDATTLSLRQVRSIGAAYGVTVNDVALAVATSAFRSLLLSRGDRCTPNTVRSLVPVSVRAESDKGIPDNRVSCLLADLPVHLPDPEARLLAVHEHLAHLKATHEAEAGAAVTELARREPFPVIAPLVRSAFHVPQHNIVTVTTNVPGPRVPLYLLGRRLVRLLPYVPIASRVRFGVAILSYCDALTFGVTGDYDTADVELMSREIRRAAEVLTECASTGRSPVAAGS